MFAVKSPSPKHAVRIPKDFAFEGVTEFTVRKVGQKLILEPVRKSWLTLNDESEPVRDDFLAERPDIFALDESRVKKVNPLVSPMR